MILVIQGHPHAGSYNRALVAAYVRGARAAGARVEVLDLERLDFDPVLHDGYAKIQPLEPDLVAAQQSILDADHLVIGFPIWWGMPPAKLKGFFDRAFLPGFAFKFHDGWPLPERLLTGRSARLVTTMDSPLLVYALAYRGSAHAALMNGTLRFSGFGPVKSTMVNAVKYLPAWLRKAHIRRLERIGARDARRYTERDAHRSEPSPVVLAA